MLSFMKEFTDELMESLPVGFNEELLTSSNDISIEELVVMTMKELEAISNYKILEYYTIDDQDEIDYNYHTVNINYKKKDLSTIAIPKRKYVTKSRYKEMVFKIEIKTNLHERIVEKRILIPVEHEGFHLINDKKYKKNWQLCDASTYSQRGKITLKSRMPIIIYNSKNRPVYDVDGNEYLLNSFSYALQSKARRASKPKTKFINPMMIFAAKVGLTNAIEFMGMGGIISITNIKKDKADLMYFPIGEDVYIKVSKPIFTQYGYPESLVPSVVCMLYNLSSREFPITKENLDDKLYWTCRIGYVGSQKDKNLMKFYEKGKTTMLMIERLLNKITVKNLRLPMVYKYNIYFVLRWLIENFSELKSHNNMDLNYKRIRKNEYVVDSSLGRKISVNINNIIEKLGKSRLNSMDSLLELLNFPSDIIMTGMKNINDLVKSDELVNDMTFLQEIAYSEKGPNSLGENSAKTISNKYRDIHPSYVGRIDCNSTSNSDPGRSGSLTPFCKLYDGFYFSPDGEPCEYRFHFEKIKQDMNEKLGTHYSVNTAGKYRSFQEYKNFLESLDMEKAAKAKCEELAFIPLFQVAPITIVEKEESNDNELSDIVDYSTLNIEDSNTTEDSTEESAETNEETDAEE